MSKENSGAVLSASVVTPTSPLVINEIDFNGHYGVKVLVNTPTVIGALRDSHSGLFLPVNKVLSDAIITAEIGNISISPTLTGEVGGEGVARE